MLKKALAAVLVGWSSFAVAQRLDLSIGAAGVFTKSSTSSTGSLTLSPTNSVAEFGSVRWHFNRKHALEINIGHTSDSQVFSLPPNDFRISTNILEYSGAYVFSPLQTRRFSPFLLGGAGALRFSAGNTYINGSLSAFPVANQTALAFLYGAGTDYHLWRIFSARLQYRGLIYKSPDFGQPNLATHAKGHLAEPSIGIVARF